MQFANLHLQLWDRDILKWSDCAGEAYIDLKPHYKRAYKKNVCVKLFETVKGAALARKKKEAKRKAQEKKVQEKKAQQAKLNLQAELLGQTGGVDPVLNLTAGGGTGGSAGGGTGGSVSRGTGGSAGGGTGGSAGGGPADSKMPQQQSSSASQSLHRSSSSSSSPSPSPSPSPSVRFQSLSTGSSRLELDGDRHGDGGHQPDSDDEGSDDRQTIGRGHRGPTSGQGGYKGNLGSSNNSSSGRNSGGIEYRQASSRESNDEKMGKSKSGSSLFSWLWPPFKSRRGSDAPAVDDSEKALLQETDALSEEQEGSSGSSWLGGGGLMGGIEDEEEHEGLMEVLNGFKSMVGYDDVDPADSSWCKLTKTDHNADPVTTVPTGEVCYSVEIWPKDKAVCMPVGSARNDPNTNPFLPPPVGRIKFSWNPFVLGTELCGPSMCAKFTCLLIVAFFIVGCIFFQPFLSLTINFIFLCA